MRLASFGLVLCLGLLAGCSNVTPEEKQLVGLWEIADAESVADRVSFDDQSDSDSKMTVEFQSSNRIITKTKMGSIDSTKNGTWKVVSFDASTKKMVIECNLQGQVDQCEIEFTSPGKIKWVPPNMAGTSKLIAFERVK